MTSIYTCSTTKLGLSHIDLPLSVVGFSGILIPTALAMAFLMVQDTARSAWTRVSEDRPREPKDEKLGPIAGADLKLVSLKAPSSCYMK